VATGHAAESDRIAWVRPADAIAAARAGEMSLFPPTAATLHDFAVADAAEDDAVARGDAAENDAVAEGDAGVGDAVARILAAPPPIEPVLPRLVLEDGQAWLQLPDQVGYPL